MRIIADFHIHSLYSKGTSKDMNLDGISEGARIKGLNLVGTGDFTHPAWLEELEEKLEEVREGIFSYKGVYFILTTEVATYFEKDGKIKRIHHVIHAPSFEIVKQVNEALAKFGDLKADGRPILRMTAAELVEVLMEISREIFVYPAHAWTPWVSCLGSFSGFDSVEECYEEQTKHVYALETGLSSDPSMNWRVSSLDKFALLSNSDSHSPRSWRLGREANVFELKKLSYKSLHEAIKKKDSKRFLYTIEVPPEYGKYHFTGHRSCGVCLHPREAMKLGNVCPKCGRKLTVGVLQRVEELADRPEGYVPRKHIPFKRLIPLCEIVAEVYKKSLLSRRVLEVHDKLVRNFGSELDVLLKTPIEEIAKVAGERVAEVVKLVREERVSFVPGYDGVYGKVILDSDFSNKEGKSQEGSKRRSFSQKSLSEF